MHLYRKINENDVSESSQYELERIYKQCLIYEMLIIFCLSCSFLYDEDPVLETISDIRHTKAIADRYEIHKLGEICKRGLNNIRVTEADVLSILETAKDFQNEQKENECIRLISEKQEAILKSQQFLALPFRRIIDIFEKMKNMNKMTEASLLRKAIGWIYANGATSNKEYLMEKVDVTRLTLDEYLDLMEEFPTFFSNEEISNAIKKIRPRRAVQAESKKTESKTQIKEYVNDSTSTEKVVKTTAEIKRDKELEDLLADVTFVSDLIFCKYAY